MSTQSLAPPVRGHLSGRYPAASLFGFVAAVAAWSVLRTPVNQDNVSIAVGFGVLVLVSTSIAALLLVAPPDERGLGLTTFRLGPWWLFKLGITFGLTSLAWLHKQGDLALAVDWTVVPLALLATSAGVVFWAMGFLMGPPTALRRLFSAFVTWSIPSGIWGSRARLAAGLLYAIGIGARLYQLVTGRFAYLQNPVLSLNATSSVNQILAQLEQFARYGLILAALSAAIAPSVRSRWILRSLFVAELGFALVSGVKEEFIFTFVVVAAVFGIVRRTISKRGIALAVVGLLILIPINGAYRQFVRGGGIGSVTSQQALEALPMIVKATFIDFQAPTFFAESVASLASRARVIDNVAIILQKTPQVIPYRKVGEFATAPLLGILPRSLWPQKPILSYGYQFGREYYGTSAAVYSSVAVTLPGDLFRHGGWWVLLIGMMIMGALVRLFEQCFYPGRDPRLLLLYVPLFLLVTNLEADVITYLSNLAQATVILLLVGRFVFGHGASREGA